MSSSEIVRLNVGGAKYFTTKSTLRKYPRSMLGAMFTENISLSKDEDGYYFIDRCGHIFQYILQFLRCGKSVLPKHFNELELLQVEADFYQIEDLISAIEHRKNEVEVKECHEVHVFLFCTLRYVNRGNEYKIIRFFKKLRDAGFKFKPYTLHNFGADENRIRRYLENDCWVLKKHKTFEDYEARGFFLMRDIDLKKDFQFQGTVGYTLDVETWIRNPRFDF